MFSQSHVISPIETCEQIVQQIKASNLNFILNESPYSINISIKKRFQKIKPNSNFSSKIIPNSTVKRETEQELIKGEYEILRVKSEKVEVENAGLRDTIAVYRRKNWKSRVGYV